MTEFGSEGKAIDPWLVRIDFPWMQIKNKWLAFLLVNTLEALLDNGIGKQSEVAAAGDWKVHITKANGRDGKFN